MKTYGSVCQSSDVLTPASPKECPLITRKRIYRQGPYLEQYEKKKNMEETHRSDTASSAHLAASAVWRPLMSRTGAHSTSRLTWPCIKAERALRRRAGHLEELTLLVKDELMIMMNG